MVCVPTGQRQGFVVFALYTEYTFTVRHGALGAVLHAHAYGHARTYACWTAELAMYDVSSFVLTPNLRRHRSASSRVMVSAAHQQPGAAEARPAASNAAWSEAFVNGSSAAAAATPAAAVAQGDSLLVLHGLASSDECDVLRSEASQFARSERDTNDECRIKRPRPLGTMRLEVSVSEHAPGHVRAPISEMLSPAGQALCDRLLRRTLLLLQREHPSLLPELFGATTARVDRTAWLPTGSLLPASCYYP